MNNLINKTKAFNRLSEYIRIYLINVDIYQQMFENNQQIQIIDNDIEDYIKFKNGLNNTLNN